MLPLSFSEYICFKHGDKSEAYDDYFLKKIIDNPVYMGKIAYGRRRTEKKTGTRNEMHVVEQSEFPVYEGIHEAIISEEDCILAIVVISGFLIFPTCFCNVAIHSFSTTWTFQYS